MPSAHAVAADPATCGTVLGLSDEQATLLMTLREVVCGSAPPCPAMIGLIEVLGAHGRRRLRLSGPSDITLTADETALLALIHAAAAGDRPHAERRAQWLVRAAGTGALIAAAERLGRPCKRFAAYG